MILRRFFNPNILDRNLWWGKRKVWQLWTKSNFLNDEIFLLQCEVTVFLLSFFFFYHIMFLEHTLGFIADIYIVLKAAQILFSPSGKWGKSLWLCSHITVKTAWCTLIYTCAFGNVHIIITFSNKIDNAKWQHRPFSQNY